MLPVMNHLQRVHDELFIQQFTNGGQFAGRQIVPR